MTSLSSSLANVAIPRVADIGPFDFLALDFETATGSRDSVCAVGLAWVRNGALIADAHCLVRPPFNEYAWMNIDIHGITPEMTAGEPAFDEIWTEILPHFQESMVIAHNAAFDMSVLRACLSRYDFRWPSMRYMCTVKIAQQVWPLLPDHRLPTVSEHLGITLQHHNAGSDAAACAEIAVCALESVGAPALPVLAERLGMTVGVIEPGFYEACRSPSVRRQRR